MSSQNQGERPPPTLEPSVNVKMSPMRKKSEAGQASTQSLRSELDRAPRMKRRERDTPAHLGMRVKMDLAVLRPCSSSTRKQRTSRTSAMYFSSLREPWQGL